MTFKHLPQEEGCKYWLNLAEKIWPKKEDLERALGECRRLKELKTYASKVLDAKIEAIEIILKNKNFNN